MKPIYRSSNLIHYLDCPKKFQLSIEHDQEQTSAMRDGLLFEGYLFGFKDNDRSQEELEGRKRKDTLDIIKAKADFINEEFQFKGNSFVKRQIEFENFLLQGESDFEGTFLYKGKKTKGIVDLKFTSNIDKNWNHRNSKREFFQSVMYPFLELAHRSKNKDEFDLDLFNQLEPLPFYYLVVENNDFEKPLYKLFPVKITRDDLKWLWNKIVHIHKAKELGYPANDSQENCLGIGYYTGRCPYFQWCEEGRALITFETNIEFSQLNEV